MFKPTENLMTTVNTQPTDINLNKLSVWKGNVRKTNAAEQINELAASIAAHGLIQPLVVRKGKKDRFEIVAGQRRFLALLALAREGRMAKDAPVPCRIVAAEADAQEISLAENIVRTPMHPADQFEAFRRLADEGKSAGDIAARFGVSESTVKKRLALGRVSPVLMQCYREGEMDLESLAAFTVTDDHAEQERVWNSLTQWQRGASFIREALTGEDIPATDKRARFVTLASYEEAGGAVRRDLFAEGERGVYLQDAALLNRLTREKLEAEAAKLQAEGWKWVECREDFGYEARGSFRQLHPEPLPLTGEQQDELDRLTAEYEALCESEDEEADERQREIETRLDELESNGTYSAEQLAISGAIVTLNHRGEIEIERGLVRADDMPDELKPTSKPKRTGISASLIEALTAHKTAILAAELLEQPDVALASAVYGFALSAFGIERRYYSASASAQLSLNVTKLKAAEGSQAHEALAKERAAWERTLPTGAAALWRWCLAQKQETLLNLLAFCVAVSTNAIRQKHDRPDCDRLQHADALAAALKLDMPQRFRPTAENYFGRISKPMIFAAYKDATGKDAPARWNGMKKGEVAAAAERELAATGWLPEPLRITETPGEDETPESGDLEEEAA
jgi:ParB family chromosome partitioning protein